jgi:hypothetical protein
VGPQRLVDSRRAGGFPGSPTSAILQTLAGTSFRGDDIRARHRGSSPANWLRTGCRPPLETYRYLYASFPDPGTQGRLLLLDGLICRKEGRLEDSETLLHQLATHYAENAMPFDLTLATLEWAESLVLLRRFDEAAEVMREVYPLIERWRVPMDVLRAWKIVQESVRARTVQDTAFRELSLTVRRKWFRGEGAC